MNKKSIAKLLSLSTFLSMPLSTFYAVDPLPSSSSVVPQGDSSSESEDESSPIPSSSSLSALCEHRPPVFSPEECKYSLFPRAIRPIDMHRLEDSEEREILKNFLQTHGYDIAIVNSLLWNEALLIRAAEDNNLNAVKVLIHAGADVNEQDRDGMTALMIAARNNNEEIARELINTTGINLELKNRFESTALMIAASYKKLEMVQLLVKAVADC